MTSEEFEPAIPALKRPQTFALNGTASGIISEILLIRITVQRSEDIYDFLNYGLF
jgi:hypothetical protein